MSAGLQRIDLDNILDDGKKCILNEISRARITTEGGPRRVVNFHLEHLMLIKEKMVAIYVPERLIPGICSFKGDILLNINRMTVEGGFSLKKGEFVTSVNEYERTRAMVGLKDAKHGYNILKDLNNPSE